MSAHEMSLLLEGDAMNVDGGVQGMQGMQDMDNAMALDDVDLFGDPVMDSALAALPPRPAVSKQLQHRLDELRARGCCQGIAWSRHGSIASIARDGMSIELRFIRCSPDSGEWELAEPGPWGAVTMGPPPPAASAPPPALVLPSAGAPFVHIAWAPTSAYELAAIDALGRIAILTVPTALNRPQPGRPWDADPVDDLHAVVGCYWLPLGVQPNKQVGCRPSAMPARPPVETLTLGKHEKSTTSPTARPPGCSPSTGTTAPSTLPLALAIPTPPRAPSFASRRTASSSCCTRKTTIRWRRLPWSSRA